MSEVKVKSLEEIRAEKRAKQAAAAAAAAAAATAASSGPPANAAASAPSAGAVSAAPVNPATTPVVAAFPAPARPNTAMDDLKAKLAQRMAQERKVHLFDGFCVRLIGSQFLRMHGRSPKLQKPSPRHQIHRSILHLPELWRRRYCLRDRQFRQ